MNDGYAGFTPQDMHLLRMFRNFTTVVFLPTDDDLSGSGAQDLCYDSVYVALMSTMFGFTSDEHEVIPYSATPTGDGPAEYNSASHTGTYGSACDHEKSAGTAEIAFWPALFMAGLRSPCFSIPDRRLPSFRARRIQPPLAL